MWSDQRAVVFNDNLYNEVNIEYPNFDEYGNDIYYDYGENQINIHQKYDSSGSDSKMDDSEDNNDNNSDSGLDQDNISDTVVFDGATVQIINLHADDSDDDIDFFN